MRRYFFYESAVSGVILLQAPGVADSVGVAQNGKAYIVKVVPETAANKTKRDALLAAVQTGALFSEAGLLTAITTALSAAKVILEDNNKNQVYGLN